MSPSRTAAAALAMARLLYGVGLIVAPERLASGWLGRALGGSSAALGAVALALVKR